MVGTRKGIGARTAFLSSVRPKISAPAVETCRHRRAKSPSVPLERLLPEASLKDVISENSGLPRSGERTMQAKKATAKKATAKKATARASSRPGRTSARRAPTPSSRASTLTAPGRSGDLIVIDSSHVGSPPREGEVLEVIHGEVSVSYRVRWADGHQTLIAPKSGTARIVRVSKRA